MRTLTSLVFVSSLLLAGCGRNADSASPANALAAPAVSEAAKPDSAPTSTAADAARAAKNDPPVAAGDPVSAPAVAAVDPGRSETVYREVTIPSGTPLTLRMTSAVSSRHSHIEDAVNATLTRPIVVGGATVIPAGAAVSGYVTESTRSARVKGRARVGVRFTSLRADDERYDIRTAAVTRQARATKKADATKIGLSAGAGALVGALTGGKKGAAIGTAVGAAGGTGVVLATRGEEVQLGPGTVTTRLTQPLTVRVRVP